MDLTRDELLKKLGAAEKEATPKVAALSTVTIQDGNPGQKPQWSFGLQRAKLRKYRRREGVYLLRTNHHQTDPKAIWEYCLLLVEVGRTFKDINGEMAIRPVITNSTNESRRTSLSHFWPIAFTRNCGCAPKLGPGLNSTKCPGQAELPHDGPRASADHRQPHRDPATPHPAGTRRRHVH